MPKTATIESIITDMGTGGSYCGNCKENLTEYLREYTDALIAAIEADTERPIRACPECTLPLENESITPYPFGGSDF